MLGVLVRRQRHTKEGHLTTEAEAGVEEAKESKGRRHHQELRGRGVSAGALPCPCLDPSLLPPRSGQKKYLLFQAISLWFFIMEALAT